MKNLLKGYNMQKTASFQVDSQAIGNIVRRAVDEGHMTLSSIASSAGLSVPTIARLYKGAVNEVHRVLKSDKKFYIIHFVQYDRKV